MVKLKFDFNNIKIGDVIKTTNNEEGTVVAIKSYAYLNDKLLRKADKADNLLIDLMPFLYDNTRHKGIWYSAITIAVQDKKLSKPTYYLEGIDFNEVKEIISEEKELSLYDKVKEKIRKIINK